MMNCFHFQISLAVWLFYQASVTNAAKCARKAHPFPTCVQNVPMVGGQAYNFKAIQTGGTRKSFACDFQLVTMCCSKDVESKLNSFTYPLGDDELKKTYGCIPSS